MPRSDNYAVAVADGDATEAELLALVDGAFATPGNNEEPRFESFTPLG